MGVLRPEIGVSPPLNRGVGAPNRGASFAIGSASVANQVTKPANHVTGPPTWPTSLAIARPTPAWAGARKEYLCLKDDHCIATLKSTTPTQSKAPSKSTKAPCEPLRTPSRRRNARRSSSNAALAILYAATDSRIVLAAGFCIGAFFSSLLIECRVRFLLELW